MIDSLEHRPPVRAHGRGRNGRLTAGTRAAAGEIAASALAALFARSPAPDQDDVVRLATQQRTFDGALARQAEWARESNALRSIAMEQMKRDDEILKDWIRLI